jgi:3-methyladenine DNA glycosylase AlkD
MRRASLISQILLFREGKGDKELFFRLAEEMIEEREFFIRKAIGWTLREMSKADPQAAFDFLLRVKDRASGLTLREGAKRLPDEMRNKVVESLSR